MIDDRYVDEIKKTLETSEKVIVKDLTSSENKLLRKIVESSNMLYKHKSGHVEITKIPKYENIEDFTNYKILNIHTLIIKDKLKEGNLIVKGLNGRQRAKLHTKVRKHGIYSITDETNSCELSLDPFPGILIGVTKPFTT